MRFKKYITILFLLLIICWIAHYELSKPHDRTPIFRKYESDFNLVVNHISDLPINERESSKYGIIYDNTDSIIGLYEFPEPLTEEFVMALNNVADIFVQDFSFVGWDKNRIDFGGEGSEMYVFTLDSEKPKYFYHEGDGVDFSCEKLEEHWYYLYNRVR